MNNRPLIALGGLIGAVVISASIATSLLAAHRLSLRDQQATVARLAAHVLKRNESITGQVRDALVQMSDAKLRDPCSDQARRFMARLALRSSLLQAVAYVRNDKIVCASLDLDNVDIGKSDFDAAGGVAVRTSRRLPIDPGATYRITTVLANGFAAVVHTDLAFDVIPMDDDVSVGIVGSLARQPISTRGVWRAQWLEHLRGAEPVEFFDGDYVVALRKSARYEYFAYAAVPASRLHNAWTSAAFIAVPIGLLTAAALSLLVFWALRQQVGLPALLKSAFRSEHELYLHYQPFVDLKTGQWIGAEALMRWRRPNGEMVSPDIFIPIAERYGLTKPLTNKLLAMVRRDMDDLLRKRPDFFISINVSSEDIMDKGFAHRLSHMVREWGIQPLQIRLEATERTLIDPRAAHHGIKRLQDLGHRIALDDFGIGYSSLSYLTTLKVDSIKIDKAFVEIIGTDAVTVEVVPHIIEMGKALGMRLIAEGIETEAQATYLTERGVEYGQGWFYCKAISPKELEKLLQEERKAG